VWYHSPFTKKTLSLSISLNNLTHFGVYDYWLTGLTACYSWLADSWLVVLNLVGTRFRPTISLSTNEKIIVRLHDNSIAGALYKNKFESSETPTRTGTVSVNCSVYCRSNDDRTWKVFRYRRNISSDGVSESDSCWQTVQCAFSVICSTITQKPKVQDPHGARWVTIIIKGQRK